MCAISKHSARFTGVKLAHVGAISFSDTVLKNINLGDPPVKDDIRQKLWNIPRLAQSTNTADALEVIT